MDNRKRIRISRLFWGFAGIFLVLGAALLVCGTLQKRHLIAMQEITEEYIAGEEAIDSMRQASDYLTEKARAFTISGDENAARAFFEEVYRTKRRDRSLETLGELATGEDEAVLTRQLSDAFKESEKLARVESYAIRLAAEGHGSDRQLIDEYLADVTLSKEDLALNADQQIKKATGMVFDEDYETQKALILGNVSKSADELTDKTKSKQAERYRITKRFSLFENILTVLMLIVIFAMMIANSLLIVRPIRKGASYIRDNKALPITGAREYAFLAETYNNILEKTRQQNQVLSYEATHDEVTGIYNRKLFETRRAELKDKDTALLLIDIDLFKEVNDQYGHQVGDKVLKTVAGILQDCFRLEDYVCRIGGDEFAVIMVSMRPELDYVVHNKIVTLRERLDVAQDIPPVTVSIGVAFSQDGDHNEDIFRKADKALYNTKENGRNGYTFYSELG